ncbi:FCS-Like Zinc finger 3-like [Triticum dicoccoides]|uniref:FCS-Like Zinc finger 3-like n=1 Tax=Triticum dicoccoides TaxID=85692 RepID=UPI001890C889|nr:FCS-Like Zinc finger 3-like [Triticum dicoccoides]
MGAGGGATPYLKRDTFAGLWMAAAFLAACGICRKPLAGEDAYIYRGEFALCSDECRKLYIKWKRACSLKSRKKAPSKKSGSSGGSCGGPG